MSPPRLLRDRFPIIPTDWSPEQALATFELVQDLTERIWARYALDIQALLRHDHCLDTNVPDDTQDTDTDHPPF